MVPPETKHNPWGSLLADHTHVAAMVGYDDGTSSRMFFLSVVWCGAMMVGVPTGMMAIPVFAWGGAAPT